MLLCHVTLDASSAFEKEPLCVFAELVYGLQMYEWSDLRIFLAVAREGSTLAASRLLNMNQTTVSRRIEALEHALGLALFTRTTRGFALTPQGQALLQKSEAVEVAALDVEVEATRLTRDLSGSIRVTAPEAMMTHLLGPIMLAYRTLHPEVRFENLSAEHRISLEKGEADIAFRAANGDLGSDTLISVRLPSITWGVYCSEDYAKRNGVPRSMTDLKDHTIVAYSGLVATLHFSRAFMSFVNDAQVATTSNSTLNMAGTVRAGLGVGLLPLMIGLATPGLVLCFPPPVETDSQWWLVASPEAYQQPRVRSFMAFAAERIRQDKSGGLRS
jgi:DNA-binding transcriptional LysR family regulator